MSVVSRIVTPTSSRSALICPSSTAKACASELNFCRPLKGAVAIVADGTLQRLHLALEVLDGRLQIVLHADGIGGRIELGETFLGVVEGAVGSTAAAWICAREVATPTALPKSISSALSGSATA